jgi:predicted nucleic acid-binding protein
MCSGIVVDIDQDIAISAAGNGLPMADSLIYATAQARGAVVWTQDAHFDGLAGAHYFGRD